MLEGVPDFTSPEGDSVELTWFGWFGSDRSNVVVLAWWCCSWGLLLAVVASLVAVLQPLLLLLMLPLLLRLLLAWTWDWEWD